VTITVTLGSSGYPLRDQILAFTTDRGAFVETNGASRTALTDERGEAQATLYPLGGEMANVTVSAGCGRPLTFGIPSSGRRTESRPTPRTNR